MPGIQRIAINTGGGDAPGLNAVIRAAVLSALGRGWEVYGIRRGYDGLLNEGVFEPRLASRFEGPASGDEGLDGAPAREPGVIRLDRGAVRGITHLGGTILGTTNRGNPFEWPVERADGSIDFVDRSDEVVERFRELGLDALVAIGGDGSLRIAQRFSEKGLRVVGVPKTIDNDLAATQVSFGFQTAVQTATDAIDKLHSTAEAHRRVMVVELMGRHTGWIALFAGISGTADVVLIPEIPYSIDVVCEKIEERYAGGREFAIVVVAEGAKPLGGEPSVREAGPGRSTRYGGIGERVAEQIDARTGRETRSLVLGHLQRGGPPTAYDRLLALRFGAAAIALIGEGEHGCMVALDPPEVRAVPLGEAIAELKRVPTEGDVVHTARALGISFGDR